MRLMGAVRALGAPLFVLTGGDPLKRPDIVPLVEHEDGTRHVPVMLHRAIVGSMERFLGILIEHHAGRFPAWLAPVQAVVLTITSRQDDYVQKTAETLKNQGLRVESDLRTEKIGLKIREHTLQRVPYLLVAGDREQESGSVAVRTRAGS